MTPLVSWVRGSGVGLLGRLGRVLASYGAAVLAARLFGVGGFGQLVLGLTIAQTLTVLGTFGMDDAYLREQTRRRLFEGIGASDSRLARRSLVAALGVSVAVASATSISVLGFSDREAWSLILPFAVASIPLASTMVLGAVAQMQDRQAYRAIAQDFGPSLCWLCAVAIAAVGSMTLRIVPVLYAGLLFALLIGLAARVMPGQELGAATTLGWREVLLSGAPFLIWRLGDSGLTWLDVYSLSVFRTHADVGVYGAAARVAAVSSIGLGSIASAAVPRIRDSLSHGQKERAREWYIATIVVGVGMGVAVVPLLLFDARWVLSLLGRGFDAGMMPMWILVVGHIANAASGPALFLASVTTPRRQLVRLIAVILLLDVLLLVTLVPAFGPAGAATATSVAIAIMNLLLLMRATRAVEWRIAPRDGVVFVAAFAVAIGVGGLVVAWSDEAAQLPRVGGLLFAGMLGAATLGGLYLRRPEVRRLLEV